MTFTLALFHASFYFVCLFLPYLLICASYRVLLHPLRALPGPLLAKLTDCYGGWHAICKRTHLNIHENHTRYGSVVRYGPDRLLFNSPQAVQDIYQSPNFTKSYLYVFSRLGGGSSIFSTMDKSHHRQKRHLYAQALSDRSMRLFEPTLLRHLDVFLKMLLQSSKAQSHVDMTTSCQYLGFDVVGSLAFGAQLNLQTEEKNRVLLTLLIAAKTQANILMHLPAYRFLNPILQALPSKQRDLFKSALTDVVKARKAQVDTKDDLYALLSAPENENMFDSLVGELVFFMTAGGTPPATTICALCFYLVRSPECYEALAQEIRTTFSTGEDIRSGTQLSSCKYLRACIDESMRINPPSLATLWREQAPDVHGSVFVDGQFVPKGTQVGINIYALHHDEEYFPDPFAFKPERWLESSTAEENSARSRSQKAFVPFIVGPRACAGKATLYLEVSIAVAKMLWYFDFKSAPGQLGEVGEGVAGSAHGRHHVNEFQMFDVFNSHHQGPNLVFKARDGYYSELL
ncbi:cytochrome P450 [Xylariaceae sp. FL1019]|nr:cytochrome P450 [Xylariaceae sp. FL1019]